jgi:serine/threonine protein kinase
MPPLALTGGTVPYMSPEQVQGEDLDARTDLFSWGVVIYEMATGRRPFIGTTAADVMDAIVHETPFPLREINPSVPDELVRIVDKAFEKNRKLRYQTATDLRADLQRLKRDLDSATAVGARTRATAAAISPANRSSRKRMAAIAGGLAFAGAALMAVGAFRSRSAPLPQDESVVTQAESSDIGLATDAKDKTVSASGAQQPPRPQLRDAESPQGKSLRS